MKKATGTLAYILGVLLLDWIVCLIVLAFIHQLGPQQDFLTFLFGGANGLGNGFLTSFINLFTNFNNIDLWQIIGWSISGALVLFLIVWVITACATKKFRYLGFLPLVILSLFPGVVTIANIQYYLTIIQSTNLAGTPDFYLAYVMGVSAALLVLVYLVFFIIGFVGMLRKTKKEETAAAAIADEIPEPTVEEAVVNFDDPQPEPLPTFVPGVEPVEEPAPEPEPAPDPIPKPEPVREAEPVKATGGIDPALLAATIREAVRDIVRDEIARAELSRPQPQAPSNPTTGSGNTITGATFGGPLVVQYFNGGINGVTAPAPAPAPAPVEEKKAEPIVCECNVKVEHICPCHEEPAPAPAPAPVVEQPAPAPVPTPVVEQPAPAPAPVVVEEPAPVVEQPAPAPVPAPVVVEEPKPEKVYERISFIDRMIEADKEMQENYNTLKNEIMSYGVKSRVSNSGDTFRLHKKTYVKITIAGKSLKLYFALDPKDYADSTLPVQDAGHKGIYEEIPLVFKVRSELSMRRCKDLIQTVMEQDALEQGEIGTVNWIKELKALAKGKK